MLAARRFRLACSGPIARPLSSGSARGEPFLGAAGIAVGAVVVRALGQAGEQRAFLERELRGGFAEIALRRHLDAPGAAAEKDEVEIKLQDLVLAQRLLEPGTPRSSRGPCARRTRRRLPAGSSPPVG